MATFRIHWKIIHDYKMALEENFLSSLWHIFFRNFLCRVICTKEGQISCLVFSRIFSFRALMNILRHARLYVTLQYKKVIYTSPIKFIEEKILQKSRMQG